MLGKSKEKRRIHNPLVRRVKIRTKLHRVIIGNHSTRIWLSLSHHKPHQDLISSHHSFSHHTPHRREPGRARRRMTAPERRARPSHWEAPERRAGEAPGAQGGGAPYGALLAAADEHKEVARRDEGSAATDERDVRRAPPVRRRRARARPAPRSVGRRWTSTTLRTSMSARFSWTSTNFSPPTTSSFCWFICWDFHGSFLHMNYSVSIP
jgi:hypothetical protein